MQHRPNDQRRKGPHDIPPSLDHRIIKQAGGQGKAGGPGVERRAEPRELSLRQTIFVLQVRGVEAESVLHSATGKEYQGGCGEGGPFRGVVGRRGHFFVEEEGLKKKKKKKRKEVEIFSTSSD